MKPVFVLYVIIILAVLAGCASGGEQPSLAPSEPSKLPEPANTDGVMPKPTLSADDLYTAPPNTPEQTEKVCYITGEGVRVREQASLDSQILCVLLYGTQLTKTEDAQGWSKVEYGDITGYVRNDYLSETAPAPRPSAPAQNLREPKIVVKKSLRLLELWDGTTLIDSYSVGLGGSPEGHKQAEGDGKTPEGEYYVCKRNRNSSFYLSLGLSYPNKQDAKAALDDGRINRRTYESIKNAIERKEKPSWDTPLGGKIMIHGCGGDSDWTAGCIAVDNDIMDILWNACPLGTPITVFP
ncbi:MAG: L,D-transpeptidase family protein [Christensenellales bacterium]